MAKLTSERRNGNTDFKTTVRPIMTYKAKQHNCWNNGNKNTKENIRKDPHEKNRSHHIRQMCNTEHMTR